MDEQDAIQLKVINAKKHPAAIRCTEDQFEDLMNLFEEAAHTKQPFAAVDNPPVVTFEDMDEQLDDGVDMDTKKFAGDVYEHWKKRRTEAGNKWLQPHLKFETHQDTDDADPYVCFRRREVRQARKTRGRDAQSAEKLKKLRKEIEDGRQLLKMVLEREVMRKQSLAVDREVFRQRAEVKETKRKLGIRGDDEDLINQKVSASRARHKLMLTKRQPKKKPDGFAAQQAIAPQRLFSTTGRGPGDDLRLLADMQAEQASLIQREIQLNREKHVRWNTGFVDRTMAPLTPTAERGFTAGSDFRHAMPATEYLPTPPASISSEPSQEAAADAENPGPREAFAMPFRYASPDEDDSSQTMPSFRRRIGRGGRTMFDRRIPFRTKEPLKETSTAERYKFDSEDEDDEAVYDIDEHDIHIMQHRAYLFSKPREPDPQQLRRAQVELAAINSRPPAGPVNGVHPPASIQAAS